MTNQISIQQGALNTPVQDIYAGLLNCLQEYVTRLQNIGSNPNQISSLSNEIQDFIEILSCISPNCKQRANGFKHRNIPISNPQYAQQLKKLLEDILADQCLYSDLQNVQAKAHQEAVVAKQQFSQQLRAAMDEKNNVASKWHKAREDSAPHDPVRYIGDLLGSLLRVNYMAPVDEEYYVRGFAYKPRTDNTYEEYLQNVYGDSALSKMKP